MIFRKRSGRRYFYLWAFAKIFDAIVTLAFMRTPDVPPSSWNCVHPFLLFVLFVYSEWENPIGDSTMIQNNKQFMHVVCKKKYKQTTRNLIVCIMFSHGTNSSALRGGQVKPDDLVIIMNPNRSDLYHRTAEMALQSCHILHEILTVMGIWLKWFLMYIWNHWGTRQPGELPSNFWKERTV